MKTNFYFLAFLLACFSCVSTEDATPDAEWNDKTEQYRTLVEREQYDGALAIAKEQVQVAEEEFPNSTYMADAYNRFGLAYRNIKDYPKAELYLKKSLAIANENNTIATSIHQGLALVYKETGRIDLAVTSIEKALDSYAAEPEVDSASMYNARLIFVELLTIKQDYKQASEILEKAVKYSLASRDSSLLMGATYAFVDLNLHLGEYEKALTGSERLMAYYRRNGKKEEYANAVNNIAAAYFMKQDYDKAIEYLKKAAEIKLEIFEDSSFIAVQLSNIALAYERNGNLEAAEKYHKLHRKALK